MRPRHHRIGAAENTGGLGTTHLLCSPEDVCQCDGAKRGYAFEEGLARGHS